MKLHDVTSGTVLHAILNLKSKLVSRWSMRSVTVQMMHKLDV